MTSPVPSPTCSAFPVQVVAPVVARTSKLDPSSAPLPMRVDGKTVFWSWPGEAFRYAIVSDKIETTIAIASCRSRRKWECRLDDAKTKACGPESVELPRSVVVSTLGETLSERPSGPHRLALNRNNDSDHLMLELTLAFSPLFAPTYVIPLEPCEMTTEDLLQAQVNDLHDELDDLRQQVAELRGIMATNKTERRPHGHWRPQPSGFTPPPSVLPAASASVATRVPLSDASGLADSLPRPPSVPTRPSYSP